MFIENSGGTSNSIGRVGIGTTDPDGLLHLLDESTSNTDLIIEKADAQEGRLVFHNAGTERANIRLNAAENLVVENDLSDGDIIFNINDGGTDTEVMRIDGSSSNVGIGVVAPTAKLQVAFDANATAEELTEFNVSDAAGDYLRFGNRTTTNGEYAPQITAYSATQTTQPALTFSAWTDPDGDEGDDAMMEFNVRRFDPATSTSTNVLSRNLFEWKNRTSTEMAMDANGNVGINANAPGWLLHVNGTAARPGGGMWINSSDENLKQDIQSFDDGLQTLLQIEPKTYRYNGTFGLSSENTYVGIIAQEVQQVAPYMISNSILTDPITGETGEFLSYDGTALTYIIVNAIKELEQRVGVQDSLVQLINNLGNELNLLQQQLNQCCSTEPMHRISSEGERRIENDKEFVLFNADPNPFEEHTTLSYYIPNTARIAEVLLTDRIGNIVMSYILEERGMGSVEVYGNNLVSGAYTCTLVLDGKPSAHKIIIKR